MPFKIKPADMYASTAFKYENVQLDPYLTKMDENEKTIQDREEEEIQREMPKHRKVQAIGIGAVSAIGTGGPGALVGLGIGATVTVATGKAMIVGSIIGGPVLGIGIGITAGALYFLDKKNGRRRAEEVLEINTHRATRLDSKIKQIGTQLLTDHVNRVQLEAAQYFFQQKLTKYESSIKNHHTVGGVYDYASDQ